nr:hypothetical protein [Erysipelothrix urinaevulpis]
MNDQLLRVVDSKGTFIQYQYDKNGNVINKRYQNDFEEKYNYNAENILTSIHNSDDRTIKFEYDHFGNRSAREETFDLHSVITSNKPKKDDQNEDKLSLNQAKHA